MSEAQSVPETVAVTLTKRSERLANFLKMGEAVVADMREQKYLSHQLEAKVGTFENRILALKDEVAKLDEQIRQKKIEVAGSFNNLRDDLSRREQALTKREAELKVAEQNAKERSKAAEDLIVKAEKVVGKQSASERAAVVAGEEAATKSARISARKALDAEKVKA